MFVTSLPLLSFLIQNIRNFCLLTWLYWCTSKPLSEQMSSHLLFSGATVKPKADGYLGNIMHSGSIRFCSWNGNVSGKVLSCGLIHNYILWPSQTIPQEAYLSAFQHCCFWPAWAVHRSHRARKGTGWELLESFWYLNRLGTSFCEAIPLLSWPLFLLWSVSDWVFTDIFLNKRRKKKKPQNTALLVSVRLLLCAITIQRQLKSVEILVTSLHTEIRIKRLTVLSRVMETLMRKTEVHLKFRLCNCVTIELLYSII